jgi:type IV secretion system protein VirB11
MSSSAQLRSLEKLRRDLGDTILSALADAQTIEIVLNSDGKLWQERLGEPMRQVGEMSAGRAEAAMRTIASCLNTTITEESPLLEGELPLDGSRFAGQMPPIVSAPTFAIRKRASSVFPLSAYVAQGIMSSEQAKIISGAISNSWNILISGGTGSGKTTLANALILDLTQQFPNCRIVLIEDTGELQCRVPNFVQYHTSTDVSMSRLLRTTLRMRPDRIIVGEVRGPEALDLLMAWNTGHPGGIATLHANSAKAALDRLMMLLSMSPEAPRQIEPLIGEAVDLIVHISRTPQGREVKEILRVLEFSNGSYLTEKLS